MAITLNSSEASKEKTARVYQKFTYDNESDGGCINKLISANKIINDISVDIEELGNKYNELQKKYDKFTDFDTRMNSNKTSLRNSIDNIRKKFEEITDCMSKHIEYFQKKDVSFINDLDAINKLISIEKSQQETIKDSRKKNDASNNERPAAGKDTSGNSAKYTSKGGNKVNGTLSPGTIDKTFAANSYSIDKNSEEYKQLVATVYAEASSRPEYTESDTMGVVSAILNRVESDKYPNNVYDVISQKNQFDGFKADNEKHKAAYNDMSVVPDEMITLIDRVLDGERNTNACSFLGDGVKNSFK